MREIQPGSGKAGDHAWLQEFSRALAREDLSTATVRGYRQDLDLFLRWYAPNKLEKLTAVDVLHYRQHLSGGSGLKPASVNRKLQSVRRFCRWAQQRGRLKSNVALEVKLARPVRGTRPQGLAEPEVHALLRAAGQSSHGLSKRNYALLQLLLQTGLRVGEAAVLHVADVVLRDRAGLVRVRHGKGDKEREVPLNSSARRGLSAYLESRGSPGPQDPLIVAESGRPISVRSLQAVVSGLARRARITRIPVSAHTCRHTFALNFLKQNPGKLVELAALLGHESLDTTAIYTRPSTEEMAEHLETSRLNVDR